MSNIAEDLLKILTSRYGKDVRQAIHDSIETCYNDGVALEMEIEPKTTEGINIADITINGDTTKLYSGSMIDDTTTDTDKVWSSDKVDTELDAKADSADLATVATSGSYEDLSNKPTIPTVNNGTLTIQQNGTDKATFSANQSGNATANIVVPTKTSDLTNDNNFVESSDLASVATSGSYEDLSDKPTIPTRTSVSVTPKVATGENIADITVDGVTTPLYAEKGSEVVVTTKVGTGTNIADIEVDGVIYSLFAQEAGVDYDEYTAPLQNYTIGELTIGSDYYYLKGRLNKAKISIQLLKETNGTSITGGIEIAGGNSYDFYSEPITCDGYGRIAETLTYNMNGACNVKLIPNTDSATSADIMTIEIWEKNNLGAETVMHSSFTVVTNTNVGATGAAALNYDKSVCFCLDDASELTTRISQTIPDLKGDGTEITTIDDALIALASIASRGGGLASSSATLDTTKLTQYGTHNYLYRSGNVVQFFLIAKVPNAISIPQNAITIPDGYRPNNGYWLVASHGKGQYSPTAVDKSIFLKPQTSFNKGKIEVPTEFTGGTGANLEWLIIQTSWITDDDMPS